MLSTEDARLGQIKMAEIVAKTPWFVVPGALVAIVALATLLFNLGGFFQKRKTDVVTHAQLREKMDECKRVHDASNETLLSGISEITKERAKIWDIVRTTSETTKIIQNDVGWIKSTVADLKRGMA